MSVYSGDFLGFQLGDFHSERLNITRVSSGNRYTDNLIPTFKDITAEIPGGDGMYYWDTHFSSRIFQIDFAYDDLREEDLRQLAKIFSYKGVQPLIFDETPYKKYMVKCASAPNLKYICFSNGDTNLYKGEGTVSFVAYYPFGISTEKYLSTYDMTYLHGARAYNHGDMPTDFQVYYDIHNVIPATSSGQGISIVLSNGTISLKLENVKNIQTGTTESKVSDYYLMINSKTNLIEGLDSNFNKVGNLYNRYITEGDFFKIEVGDNVITSKDSNGNNKPFEKLEYNVLYY